MSSQMFISVNETFLIRDSLPNKILNKCLNFVVNHKNLDKENIENAYKTNISKLVKIPQKFYKEDVHVIIKTKFNKDYKYININKSIVLSNLENETKKFLKKIDRFQLEKINFFPKTYSNKKIVFQVLAKGNFYRPNKLSDICSNLKTNIASIINDISAENVREIKISKYLDNFKFLKVKDQLNLNIRRNFIFILNKYKKEDIKTSLTHGDFKFDHLSSINGNIEYLIDWENVGIRSIFFDLMNFFIPWFVKRSYNFFEIKKYICKFINDYLPNLEKDIQNKFEIYFCLYGLERYERMHNGRTVEFNIDEAYRRYNFLFKELIKETSE